MKEWNTRDSRLLDVVPVPQARDRDAERLTAARRALFDGVASYADLPWISDDLASYDRALRSVAFLSVGKMPAGRTTSDATLAACYANWKSILFHRSYKKFSESGAFLASL